ncbi:MAG: hypothetical protein BWY70_00805 [Bacteroidetes bacterium ADurb.Bin408]|nr:MAG: hypothetical protein BWY70_00805 [Bacteroidetes bacterium ADurb.Bin408]
MSSFFMSLITLYPRELIISSASAILLLSACENVTSAAVKLTATSRNAFFSSCFFMPIAQLAQLIPVTLIITLLM